MDHREVVRAVQETGPSQPSPPATGTIRFSVPRIVFGWVLVPAVLGVIIAAVVAIVADAASYEEITFADLETRIERLKSGPERLDLNRRVVLEATISGSCLSAATATQSNSSFAVGPKDPSILKSVEAKFEGTFLHAGASDLTLCAAQMGSLWAYTHRPIMRLKGYLRHDGRDPYLVLHEARFDGQMALSPYVPTPIQVYEYGCVAAKFIPVPQIAGAREVVCNVGKMVRGIHYAIRTTGLRIYDSSLRAVRSMKVAA